MLRFAIVGAAVLGLTLPLQAQTAPAPATPPQGAETVAPPPVVPADQAAVIARNSYALTFDGEHLAGPGSDMILKEASGAQFVLLGEYVWHVDHATPLIARALFDSLHARDGFQYYAAEQDYFGGQRVSQRPLRGDVGRIAAFIRAHPYALTFINDEELQLLAHVARNSKAKGQPIWGFDQAFGLTATLEELVALAPDRTAREAAEVMLLTARQNEALVPDFGDWRGTRDFETGHFLAHNSTQLVGQLSELRTRYHSRPGSRADQLLTGLEQSARVFSYGQRAGESDPPEGVPVGWFNNSVREELMRSQFIANYRAAVAAGDALPKVLIKAGSNHLMQGRSISTNTFPIGNFFHELATFNGRSALSIAMVPIQQEEWTTSEQLPPELQVLLGPRSLTEATLVDVRPLRNYFHNGSRFGLKDPLAGAKLRDLVFGADFVLFYPSRRGSFALTAPA